MSGEDITELSCGALRRARQKIGMIFQHFNLTQNRTVYDNAAYALRVGAKSQAEIALRVPEILCMVGLEDKALRFGHYRYQTGVMVVTVVVLVVVVQLVQSLGDRLASRADKKNV